MPRRGARHRWMLVDAHNLLYPDRELGRHMVEEPERARRALELRLAGRPRIHLFYDGGPGGQPSRQQRQGLEIHYSGTGSADDQIIAWLQSHPDRRCIVVTADRELAARARAHGATIASAKILDGPSKPQPQQRTRRQHDDDDRGPPPPNEVDDWLRWFGVE
jgi:hypothetical protein